MSEAVGHSVRMSLGRRFISDLLHAGMKMPLVTIQKDINIAELASLRAQAQPGPSWTSIFTKAYGMVVASRPEMRRVFMSFPWERMFEYRVTTADITMEVCLDGENVLAFGRIDRPESLPLLEIDRLLAWYQADPIMRLYSFRPALWVAHLPRVVRRCIWWCVQNVSGTLRAPFFGTFGVTSVGRWGVESVRPIAPATSILHYGVIGPQGNVSVRMTYDHRIMDGTGPSLALNELEQFLKTDIVAELKAVLQAGPAEPLANTGAVPATENAIDKAHSTN